MGKQLHTPTQAGKTSTVAQHRLTHTLEQQCLRILRCTASALFNSPGGLQFRPGTQPWLDALTPGSGNLG